MKTLRNMTPAWMLLAMVLGGCGIEMIEVRDDFSGRGVSDAKVSYTRSNSSQEIVLGRTDYQGSLILVMPKDVCILKVTRNGYKPFSQPLSAIERRHFDDALEIRIIPLAEGTMQEFDAGSMPRF